jgi:3-keto-L-gulonate-6-phosphate decarboxylase
MKTAKKHSTITVMLIVLFSVTFTNTNAQLKTPSSVGTYEKGTVTLKNGKEVEGYIYMDMMNPQEFQKRVNLIDEKNLSGLP